MLPLIFRAEHANPFCLRAAVGDMGGSGGEVSALVLQGGGALGSYQAGAYDALLAASQRIDWVAGISVGAIICGNPPERRVEQLAKFWRQTSSAITTAPFNGEEVMLELFDETSAAITATFGAPGFFRPRMPPMLPGFSYPPERVSLYDTAPLRETLLSLVDFDLLNSGATRYSIGAVNVKSGNFRYFDTTRERIGPEHVMASGALPPAFPMVEIEGDYYWDGASSRTRRYSMCSTMSDRRGTCWCSRWISSARAATCRGRCSRSPSARRTFAIPRAPA
jgi:NTE family protein